MSFASIPIKYFEHDPEKRMLVFRKRHAPTTILKRDGALTQDIAI